MSSKDLRASIALAMAAALGVTFAACGGEKPAKAPNLTASEVAPSGSASHVMPSGSTMEGSCAGGADHGCGAMKEQKKP